MAKKRSQHSADFKFRLALEAAKGQHTLSIGLAVWGRGAVVFRDPKIRHYYRRHGH